MPGADGAAPPDQAVGSARDAPSPRLDGSGTPLDAPSTPTPDGPPPVPGAFKPFFAAPRTSGTVAVRLQPTEAVAAG